MGLGKTIEVIALLGFLREYKNINSNFLIVVPKSTIPNWMKEFKKWLPEARVVNLIAKKEFREDILRDQLVQGKFDVCVTTYEGVRYCLSALKKFTW